MNRLPRWLKLAPIALAALIAAMVMPVASGHANTQAEGLVCTRSASASFALTAKTGYILTPDGNAIFMWSYANGNDPFQYPGPNLCVNQGDKVTITLHNNLNAATSIMFPGQQKVNADGVLSKPDFANNTLTKAAAPGKSVTYTFTATDPGTYIYQSGTDSELQTRMGLVGALIVYPRAANGVGAVLDHQAYADPWTAFSPNTSGECAQAAKCEYIHLLSEVDPDMHHAIEAGATTYDLTLYHPHYYFINGRAFPDTISPNFAQHLPSQPYSALVHVTPQTSNSLPALVRYINAGPVTYPFHPHSNHEKEVGIDGRELVNPAVAATGASGDTSIDRFGVVVPPGQTLDTLFVWKDAQSWDAINNPIDVTVPNQQNRFEGPFWSGSPYLGVKNSLAVGVTQYNLCGEMYHVAHSHALFQATNYGLTMGGMLTMIRVDPPPSNGTPNPACTSQGY
jgi:FtsP/CotA-like multicopper oxidase with cupredoxin domain